MLGLLIPLVLLSTGSQAPTPPTERFAFEVGGNELVGFLDRPVGRGAMATIVLVPGYGRTNVHEQRWIAELRPLFTGLAMNVLVWDKPGCGESEGEFDIDQPVASSAEEVVAAVRALRERGGPGSEAIGLWGVSRAGWIAPLALRAEPSIAFWISVSGTDDKENARYLLSSNWPLEGRSEGETATLVAEWQTAFDLVSRGGSYQEYLDATRHLREDPFMQFMGWDGAWAEEDFLADQARFARGELHFDEETGLMVHVPGFRRLLSSLDLPVLALFGEKDTNVDWRSTAALYRETLGKNPAASLTIQVFPDANHALKPCETGGVREMREMPWDTPYVEGYHDEMRYWLVAHGFGAE